MEGENQWRGKWLPKVEELGCRSKKISMLKMISSRFLLGRFLLKPKKDGFYSFFEPALEELEFQFTSETGRFFVSPALTFPSFRTQGESSIATSLKENRKTPWLFVRVSWTGIQPKTYISIDEDSPFRNPIRPFLHQNTFKMLPFDVWNFILLE